MSAYSPSLVANAFLYKARQSGAQLSHMKLQKLVFFMHAWSLALAGGSVVAARPEAWTYGPVFDTLYHELKGFGSRPVDGYLVQMNPLSGQREAQIPHQADEGFWRLLDQVWGRYSPLTALQLSELSHEPGGPWEQARKALKLQLDDEVVRDFYRAKLAHGA